MLRRTTKLDKADRIARAVHARASHAPQCPHCRQPISHCRGGVRLSPLKAHIFDVVERAGPAGIMIADINAICFDGNASHANVRSHILQINDTLAETNLHISGGGSTGCKGFFRIRKQKASP